MVGQEDNELEELNKKLRKLEGKYINDISIFEIQSVEKRLMKLLGYEVYEEVEECFMTFTPYKIKGDIFYFWGKSELSYNNCNIAIDLKSNIFHVKIYYDESDEERVFSEDLNLFKKLPSETID